MRSAYSKMLALPGIFHKRAGANAVMSGMRTVVVDKIASVTQACGLSHEVRISPDIPCEEGVVLVVEILNNKSTYNTLELTSGRMAKVSRGDIVVGALGHRKALFGYSGHIPAVPEAGRRDPDAEHRRRARHLRLGDPGQGQAFRLPGARRGADLPLSRRTHRRAGEGRLQAARLRPRASTCAACRSSRSPAPAWRRARPPRPRRSSRACAIAASSSTRSRRPAFPCAATSSRSRTPAPGAR